MIINTIHILTNVGEESYTIIPDNTGITNTINSLVHTIKDKEVLKLTITGVIANSANPESALTQQQPILYFNWEKTNEIPVIDAIYTAFLR